MSDTKNLTPTQKLTAAETRITDLEAQVTANADLATKLAALNTEHEALKSQFSEANAKLTDSTKALEAATNKVAELEKSKIDVEAEVTKRSSVKAQEILASTGSKSPVAATTQSDKPFDTKPPISGLTGLEKVTAAFAEQLPKRS